MTCSGSPAPPVWRSKNLARNEVQKMAARSSFAPKAPALEDLTRVSGSPASATAGERSRVLPRCNPM
jgi:hypothetical protein